MKKLNDQCETDINEIKGIFDANAVKEISLFESLMRFFHETSLENEEKGLNEAFIHSYSSMLDCVHMELFQENNADKFFLVESKSLSIILQYLKIIFEKLTSKILTKP